MKNVEKTLLITGAGAGLGHAFAEAALQAGHRVIGTVRREDDRAAFEAQHRTRANAVILDVSRFDTVEAVVHGIEEDLGPIDVLVNNAGYGHEGILEESPLAELIRQFEVNVFGAVAVIKAVLPYMRQRRRGHIVNITSMAGYAGLPGIAYYSGSKFALEGISDALAKEVKDSESKSRRSRRDPFARSGPDARWSARDARLQITTRCSIRCASVGRNTADTRQAIRPRRRRHSFASSTHVIRLRTCCWAMTPSNLSKSASRHWARRWFCPRIAPSMPRWTWG